MKHRLTGGGWWVRGVRRMCLGLGLYDRTFWGCRMSWRFSGLWAFGWGEMGERIEELGDWFFFAPGCDHSTVVLTQRINP